MAHDGPYPRVLLPDVLLPDWDTIGRDLELELEAGVTHVTLVMGECSGCSSDDPGLAGLSRLRTVREWTRWWFSPVPSLGHEPRSRRAGIGARAVSSPAASPT